MITFTANRPLRRHQSVRAEHSMLAMEQGTMMAKVCLYLYVVLFGLAFLLQRPTELALAIGP